MNKTAKVISAVTILLLFSKLLGFVREMVIAAYFGATWQTDAYNMALVIVGILISIISTSISIIIPMYIHKKEEKSTDEANLFANNIFCITSFLCVVFSVAGIIFAPVLVKIFALNFDEKTTRMTTDMLRIMFIFSIGTNAVNYLSTISRANQKHLAPSLIGFPIAITTIMFTILFSSSIGIFALVASFVVYTLVQVVMLVISVRDIFKIKFIMNFTNGDFKDVINLSLPLYLVAGVNELDVIIHKMIASGLPEGSISAIGYAKTISGLPCGIITASLVAIIFPKFSQYAARQDFESIKAVVVKSVSIIWLCFLPIIATGVYYNTQIIKIAFERGTFTPEITSSVANIFLFYILSIVFVGSLRILDNAFFSIKDTKTPVIVTIISLTCNIILSLILVGHMQTAGLALATSTSNFIWFVLLFILFRRKFGSFGGVSLAKNVAKYIFATFCMIPVFFLCEVLRDKLPLFFFFATSVAISLCIYALILYILKADLFMEALNIGKSYLKKGLAQIREEFL